MTITVENLSPKQMFYADILWQLDGRDQVTAFLKSLPAKERTQAQLVLELMLASIFDQTSDTEMARSVLDQFRK